MVQCPKSSGYNLWQVDKLRSAQSEEEWKALLFTLAEQLDCRVKQRSVQNAVRYCEKCLAIKPDRCVQCCWMTLLIIINTLQVASLFCL